LLLEARLDAGVLLCHANEALLELLEARRNRFL
jgi:hypothetical protein